MAVDSNGHGRATTARPTALSDAEPRGDRPRIGIAKPQQLVASAGAADDLDARWRHARRLRHGAPDRIVRAAFDGRCVDAHDERTVAHAEDLRAPRAGLSADAHEDVVVVLRHRRVSWGWPPVIPGTLP